MGKAQVAKWEYFCWEGEEVTEWTQCCCELWAAAAAFRAGVIPQLARMAVPALLRGPSQSITIWARDTSQEDTNPGADSHHLTHSSASSIYTKACRSLSPLRCSSSRSLRWSYLWTGQVGPVLQTRNAGHRESMWVSSRGVRRARGGSSLLPGGKDRDWRGCYGRAQIVPGAQGQGIREGLGVRGPARGMSLDSSRHQFSYL